MTWWWMLAAWPALAGAAAPVVGRVLHGAERGATAADRCGLPVPAADRRERRASAPRVGGPGRP